MNARRIHCMAGQGLQGSTSTSTSTSTSYEVLPCKAISKPGLGIAQVKAGFV